MQLRRIYLCTILAAAAAGVAVTLAAFPTSSPHIRPSSAPIHDLPLDDLGIPGVSVDIDAKVPNLNSVEQVVPNVSVPNINLPNVKVNPGHVGLPGRGR